MYLATNRKNRTASYMIRHSFLDGDIYKSRDLFDLGKDPARFIVYPGGNGFYIAPEVEDAIEKKGLPVSQDDLEIIFWDFIDPEIKRAMGGFRRSGAKQKRPVNGPVHIFDKRRLVYLKSASVDQRNMTAFPDTFFNGKVWGTEGVGDVHWIIGLSDRKTLIPDLRQFFAPLKSPG